MAMIWTGVSNAPTLSVKQLIWQQDVYKRQATESTKKAEKTEKIALSDGTYTAEFTTDSSMFHVNDAYDNKGCLLYTSRCV